MASTSQSQSEFQPQVESQEGHPSYRPSQTQSIAPPPAEPQAYQPKRSACNPCGCWCCKCCNLRISLMVNAAITVACFGFGIYSAFNLPPDCKNEKIEKNAILCEYKYGGDVAVIGSTRQVLYVSLLGARSCELIASIFVLIAFCGRSEGCATAGGTFYIFETICVTITFWAYKRYLESWPGLIFPSVETWNTYEKNQNLYKFILYTMGFGGISLCIYFAICCFQFGEQIRLGIDLAPHKPGSCREYPHGAANQQVRPTAPPAYNPPPVQPSYVNPYPAYPPPQYGAYQGPPQYTMGAPSQYGNYPPSQYNAYPPPQYNNPPPPQNSAYPPSQYNNPAPPQNNAYPPSQYNNPAPPQNNAYPPPQYNNPPPPQNNANPPPQYNYPPPPQYNAYPPPQYNYPPPPPNTASSAPTK